MDPGEGNEGAAILQRSASGNSGRRFRDRAFRFAQEYARAVTALVDPTGTDPTLARYVAIAALIRMKEDVGRPRDLDDVEHLRWILEEQKDE